MSQQTASFFIDCEFSGDELISIALVPRSGGFRTIPFYCVLDYDKSKVSQWVSENVIPVLGTEERVSLEECRQRLDEYLGSGWCLQINADWPSDIAWFCRLIADGPNMRIRASDMLFFVDTDLNSAKSKIPHNALEDALAIRESSK